MGKFVIERPVLLLNEQIMQANIERMFNKASSWRVNFRPHFKTHQSEYIAGFFRRLGVESIAVSSLKMAEYFADHGWKNILLAFPVNLLEINLINKLLKTTNLSVFIEEQSVAEQLNAKLKNKLSVYLKIDAGYGRTGMKIENTPQILDLLAKINKLRMLHWMGFGIHAGNSYHTSGKENISKLAGDLQLKMVDFRKKIESVYPNFEITFGDTPILSTIENLAGIDEIRPGNFVFYDAMQWKMGTCNFSDIAVALAAPVVSKHCYRNEVVIYGGAIHLSKEFILNTDGSKNYGYVSKLNAQGWSSPIDGAYVKSLSQEHGIVHLENDTCKLIQPGDVLAIIPIHSCLTANLLGRYTNLQGLEINMFRY
jgi:D-serine deaminase-like pyridoxal phosphate-dependent protein